MPDPNEVQTPTDSARGGEAALVGSFVFPPVVYGITSGGQPKRWDGIPQPLAPEYAVRDPRVLGVDYDRQGQLDHWPPRSQPRPSPTE
ncbi:hypothetical protein [Streptomyces sp. NPDC055912]|uniref:hypothetical protein n=1 Tax=Streptomyces sp. NPDC055912 TaxID=3345660 RepID=UPI0035E04F8C